MSGLATILPLGNYRIIDLGTAWAGPMAAQILADMGAEVIKVESRARLDGLRLGRPIVGEDITGGDRGLWPELQPVFHSINRNKLSVTLNLKSTEGVTLLKGLIARSDVLLNNYSPGVLQRLGLGYPELQRLRPDVILVSMPAAGDTGPLRNILAYAPNIQALSGLMNMVGYQEGETLVGELQAPWSDVVSSLHAALATVAALRHRNLTGEGQSIEVAQLEATTSLLGEAAVEYQMTGHIPGPRGNFVADAAPHNNYPCAGEDNWVAIAVSSEEEWKDFCRALGNPDWCNDPVFKEKTGRLEHISQLDQHVADWTRKNTASEIVRLLQDHGVAAMPVMNIEDQFLDPHWQARQTYAEIEHPHLGAEWIYGVPWLLSDTPGSVRSPAPLLGQHNDYVLRQLLGLSGEELERLQVDEVIY